MKYEAIELRANRYAVRPFGKTFPVRYVKATSSAEAIAKAYPQITDKTLATDLLAVL